jgi:HPt (histidine-containing phosphotransfer) domain-containing protein
MGEARPVDKDWRQRVDPFFQEMLAEFEENLLKDSARLKEMVESGGLDGAERIAHNYKGSAGYFDLTELCEVARTLEVQCKTGDKESARSSLNAWLRLIEDMEIDKAPRG